MVNMDILDEPLPGQFDSVLLMQPENIMRPTNNNTNEINQQQYRGYTNDHSRSHEPLKGSHPVARPRSYIQNVEQHIVDPHCYTVQHMDLPSKPVMESAGLNTTVVKPNNWNNPNETIGKNEITIVLLGESGVGKSTFINAFVNYLSFASLDAANDQPICLIPPNEARLDVLFKYCLFQLFTQLNKSAANNILFLFTNSRSTDYMPGDSGLALLSILDQIRESPPNVDIPYNRDTVYCFDSESFRYLVASVPPNNIQFEPRLKSTYIESWDRSVNECQRLLNHIIQLPAHKPKTVCGHDQCCNTTVINHISKPNYHTPCHSPCYLHYNDGNIMGNRAIRLCKSFNKYNTKDHDSNKSKEVLREVPDNNTCVKSVALTESEGPDHEIRRLDQRIDELSTESETIINSMALFACFLANNTLTACPDAFDDYVHHLMSSQPYGTDRHSRAIIAWFEQFLHNYRHAKLAIVNNMPYGVVITVERVAQVVRNLSMMKHNGHLFRNILSHERQTKVKYHVIHNEIDYKNQTHRRFSLATFLAKLNHRLST
ncbi:unnamed protein product [Medioppia subpectinata]|uniref:DUF8206 domain-containing protein n=1 Tax=Medioppia subpectinata TaxID=1979941 RepID=A0A7R9L3N5_9ACAR|nr:unnamed protein product [Medioppia subpectinata]CAG2114696.1 unnamed protein product [Medioppia subpectinata]